MDSNDTSLIGKSRALQEVRKTVSLLAPHGEPVFITGETGTGKELVARDLHLQSKRSGYAFVAINCAALPEHLLESELFGHVRGAFTGAITDQRGKILEADGGTLFLDEIGDMSLGVQAKLLRVLQDHEVVRLGTTQPIHVNIRVVSATNRDITKAVADGRFRQDLYYRLHVHTMHLLPLKNRKLDVLPIAKAILKQQPGSPSLTRDAQEALLLHNWPGNVRELKNALHSACARSRHTIKLPALPEPIQAAYMLAPPRTDRIIDAVTRMEAPTLAPLSDELGIPVSTLKRLLSDLIADGALDRVGRRYRAVSTTYLKPRQELALEHLRKVGRISRQEFMKIGDCSERTASRDLAELVNLGLIKPDGRKGKAAGYILARNTGMES